MSEKRKNLEVRSATELRLIQSIRTGTAARVAPISPLAAARMTTTSRSK